jgi:hypothetical protein
MFTLGHPIKYVYGVLLIIYINTVVRDSAAYAENHQRSRLEPINLFIRKQTKWDVL